MDIGKVIKLVKSRNDTVWDIKNIPVHVRWLENVKTNKNSLRLLWNKLSWN